MIDWASIRKRLLVAVAVVAGLGLAAEALHTRSHADVVEALVAKLSLSYESNLPTWFSSSLLLIPFIRALHPSTRVRLIIAGRTYVGGALVMELPLGWWTETHGSDGFGYALIDWVEESMEMVGATLAFVALLAHREVMQREVTN